ncbi:hypothetical protein QA612_14835 [Evansella sp. AB-P1]|uniref:hypothetical protein n=1 Tax=Evansella sp. AB-P1 TaxID=3037653 RepID=UPI00241F0877|nr:hypothetical protein [Evansella sp. AB-P1]MDG5788749.1 hypothetical protein [Evansella sp. AB-P1]
MSVIPQQSVDYSKNYAFKTNNNISVVLDPMQFDHFHEGTEHSFSWKWINLPMKSAGRRLNKLVVYNNTYEPLSISILIKYELMKNYDSPLVYYSPSKDALVAYDGSRYRLFGGISEYGTGEQFSTVKINVNEWGEGHPLHFQPLTKKSNGWGLEFQMHLQKKSSSFLYEWEFLSHKLSELEELHSQYHELLSGK